MIWSVSSARARAHVMRHTGSLGAEDLESLLERLDLLLARSHALLVADAGIHARGLQLLEVVHRRGELLLRGGEVLLGRSERGLLARLLAGLALDVRRLHRLVLRSVIGEPLERRG